MSKRRWDLPTQHELRKADQKYHHPPAIMHKGKWLRYHWPKQVLLNRVDWVIPR